MKYVMSDIHGCYEEFKEILSIINFKEEDELFIIGDVIDRGPHPIKLLLYIMEQKNIHMIMGNHEIMMKSSMNDPFNRELWLYNGGSITEQQFKRLSPQTKIQILEYLDNLPMGLEVNVGQQDYILIHGGPTDNFIEEWDNKDLPEDVLWNRVEIFNANEVIYPGKIIVVGHTPTSCYGYDGKVIFIGDIRLIDCGCVFGYSLGCLCLDTQETFYIKKGGS